MFLVHRAGYLRLRLSSRLVRKALSIYCSWILERKPRKFTRRRELIMLSQIKWTKLLISLKMIERLIPYQHGFLLLFLLQGCVCSCKLCRSANNFKTPPRTPPEPRNIIIPTDA
ncbi:uncharacterized protein BDV17DRAFT_62993 [Aspergillus undulatus]|uniref:uncharacterized protein n=1 Tax=Aspergillus undulatus TaxID=1810928 RepID=UPI003CCD5A94